MVNKRGHRIAPSSVEFGQLEHAAREYLEKQFVASNPTTTPADVHVRDLIPGEDLEPGANNAAAVDGPRFAQEGPQASANPNEVYRIDPDLGISRGALAIVGITIRGANATTEVQFQTSPGGVLERAQIQGGYADREGRVLFNSPVVYDLGVEGAVSQSVERDSDDTIIYEGFVAEPAGTTLGQSLENLISSSSD